jgi:hypothetical protein
VKDLAKHKGCKGEHKRASQLILEFGLVPMGERWERLLRNPSLVNIGLRWKLRSIK